MAREMKDSGVQWIGEIPKGWTVSKVKYLGSSSNGLTYAPADVCDENEGILVLRSSNIQNGKFRYLDNVYVKSAPKTLEVRQGDIVICSRNGSSELVGKCAIVEDEIYATYGAFMLRFHPLCNNKYVYYLLTTTITNYKASFATTTINQLTQSVLSNMSLPYTNDVHEQQAIADFLDAKCAEIDGLLADLDAEVKTLAEYKKSIIAETVTRGLNPNAPMKQSGIPWAETTPAHWEMFRLRFVVQIVSDYKNSSSIKVGLENIESWTGKYIPSETEFEGNGNYFGNNDILFGKLRPYLAKVYLAEFEGQAIGDFLVFRTKECAVPKYVKFFLLNPLVIGLINSFTYGAKMPRANWQGISKVFMPIPPIEEQEAIASYLDEKCAIIDQSIADKQTQIETLKSYKASLIYEYVTGKKQVI